MAQRSKRLTRKDIRRPDHFLAFTADLLGFVSHHRARVLAIAFLIVGILSSLWLWDIYRARQSREASAHYFRAVNLYQSGKYQEALDGFKNVASYRSFPYKPVALLHLANSHIALNEPSEAIAPLKEVLAATRSDPLLKQVALLTLGHAEELSGQCKEAVAHFLAAENTPGPLKDDAILAAARCSTTNGDLAGALAAYRRYVSNFPGSDRLTMATLRAQELEEATKGKS